MCYATDTSNEYQLSRLTSDFETRLAVPALWVIQVIEAIWVLCVLQVIQVIQVMMEVKQVKQVTKRMPEGWPIIHVNIRLRNEAGGTCIMSDTSYRSDISIMCYASNTSDISNEDQLSTLTYDLEMRLVVPALWVIQVIEAIWVLWVMRVIEVIHATRTNYPRWHPAWKHGWRYLYYEW